MTDGERDRVRQYVFRKYDSFGPKELLTARERLYKKIERSTNISKFDFDGIIEDLIDSNDWSEPRAMAYFECISIEDRT